MAARTKTTKKNEKRRRFSFFSSLTPEKKSALLKYTGLTVFVLTMFTLVSIVPGISLLLCSIPMFFYKIAGKEKEQIISELAVKRQNSGISIEE